MRQKIKSVGTSVAILLLIATTTAHAERGHVEMLGLEIGYFATSEEADDWSPYSEAVITQTDVFPAVLRFKLKPSDDGSLIVRPEFEFVTPASYVASYRGGFLHIGHALSSDSEFGVVIGGHSRTRDSSDRYLGRETIKNLRSGLYLNVATDTSFIARVECLARAGSLIVDEGEKSEFGYFGDVRLSSVNNVGNGFQYVFQLEGGYESASSTKLHLKALPLTMRYRF